MGVTSPEKGVAAGKLRKTKSDPGSGAWTSSPLPLRLHKKVGARARRMFEEGVTRPVKDPPAGKLRKIKSYPGSCSEAEAEMDWYTSLYEEDSKKLLELLEDSTMEALELWKRGWEKEPERRVRGRPRNYWKTERETTSWMGRTALHVGATRGNVKLLEKILKLSENEGEWSRCSLEKLLLTMDGGYELDAIAMAVVNGNRDVVITLLEAGRKCSLVRMEYGIREYKPLDESGRRMRKERVLQEDVEDDNHRQELRKIMREVIETYEGESTFRQAILRRYERHRDYNFLPLKMYPEYLFHFLFTRFESVEADTLDKALADTISMLIMTEIADKVSLSSADLLKYLWKMQDGQGRPPLHVAVDEERDLQILSRKALTLTRSALSVADDVLRETIRARDGAGRTALHRELAKGDMTLNWYLHGGLSFLDEWEIFPGGLLGGVEQKYTVGGFDEGRRTVVAKAFDDCLEDTESSSEERSTWDSRAGDAYTIRLSRLSKKNSSCANVWTNCAPVHSALLHGHVVEVAFCMMEDHPRRLFTDFAVASDGKIEQRWDTLALAMLCFDSTFEYRSALERMVKKRQEYVKSKGFHMDSVFSGTAISAALGRYDALQFLIDHKFDLLEPCQGESLLHYATKGIDFFVCGIDIFTFVSCEHILIDYKEETKRWEKMKLDYENSFNTEEGLVRRQGCINLLIQQGCDIFKTNSKGEVPYPNANSKPKFLEWWHEKQLREFQAAQNAQNIASNAISVVAALVATASYVGPLQPPLGYGEDTGGLQLEILAVEVFTICDTMSFYLAIAAILFALCPCLPMPQQPMLDEFQRTRRTVNMAVALLFPSIICVLVAFAAGSIAVVQADQAKWTNIVTAAIGGLICLIAFVYFSIRVLAIFFHRKPFFKKLYQGLLF